MTTCLGKSCSFGFLIIAYLFTFQRGKKILRRRWTPNKRKQMGMHKRKTTWSFEISVNILRNQKLMNGLDSYSRQVFNYLDPILIHISL